jgi:hypothetical protein
MVDKHHALAREEILEALTSYNGVTTADGATPGNNTLIDSALIGKNDFLSGKLILIGSGVDAAYEDKGADSFDNVTGEITVSAGFSAQIKEGTPFKVLNVSSGGVVSSLLNAIKAKTDLLPATPADQATSLAIQIKVSKLLPYIDIWSPYLAQVQISTAPGDQALPSITMAGLPSGTTVNRAVMMLKVRTIENTNALVNSVSGAQNIQAEKAVGGAWITGIALAGGEFSVPATIRENGDVLMGSQDISAQIPANGALISFKWALAKSAQNNLNFNDIQVGVRVWYTV